MARVKTGTGAPGTPPSGAPVPQSSPPTPSGGTSPTPATSPKKQPPKKSSSKNSGGSSGVVSNTVSTGAGFILATLFWVWVGLPFIQNGATGVKNQLRAKFLNKAPDGSWLP